jgi:hypothetical protein
MITVIRTTNLIPHQFNSYLEIYARVGWSVAKEYLGDCAGAYMVEVGPQQQLIELWRRRDPGDWTEARARLREDSRWRAFRVGVDALIREESERAYRDAPFMPVKNLTDARDFVEMRIYRSHPGVLDRFLDLYAAEGLPIQIDYLGHCLGYFRSLDGRVDEVAHLWGYSDLNDRIKRRAALFADPEFKKFLLKGVPHFQRQENMILRPAAFWRP